VLVTLGLTRVNTTGLALWPVLLLFQGLAHAFFELFVIGHVTSVTGCPRLAIAQCC